ncbi:Carbohydrate-selective porin OprB [uncultured Paludibacter sp.]|uniref:Carbohydrate-selective porin OprB n=1 Tax=uncultured Paludibacter sp. TaxID=497635 RepID=A0A653AK62_9BACT|nr:Carbohydrate-selective porin OprB [uncultured Paludibacter sp.]
MKKETLLLLFLSIAAFYLQAQETENESENSLTFAASYVGDNVANLSGGIKKGYTYLGFANFEIALDIEKAGLWKGGQFFINAANTHGGTPTETLFGDIQVVSNIEAGNHTYLQELWYKQQLGKVEFTIGLQDLNVELASTEYGGLFLNSSFGIIPTFSLNLHAPIFPLTSPGITSKWNISERTSWINAIYDGSPTDFEENPYNIKWQFKKGDGVLGVTEIQHQFNLNNLSGTYKIGVFAHDHFIERRLDKNFPDSLNTNTWGVYSIIDQKLWESNDKNIGAFLQAGYSPSKLSTNNLYLGLGLNASGFLSKKGDDILGFSVAHAHLTANLNSETAIELTWQKPIGKYLFIQPDIQYIIHPSGQSNSLKNALAAIFRFGFTF